MSSQHSASTQESSPYQKIPGHNESECSQMFDAETLLAKVIVGLHGEQEFEKLIKKSGFNMGISKSQDRQLQELNR